MRRPGVCHALAAVLAVLSGGCATLGLTRTEVAVAPPPQNYFAPEKAAGQFRRVALLPMYSGSFPDQYVRALDAAFLSELSKRELVYLNKMIVERVTLMNRLDNLGTRRFALLVLAAFGAVALALAAAGLYGVLTVIATQQRREIGVRLALGARWMDVIRLMLARALAMVAVGIIAGTAGAFGAGRLLSPFLYGVSPSDPWAIGGAASLVVAMALPASLFPASRAAATNLVEVLRPD